MKIVAANFKTNHTRKSTKEYIAKLSNYLEQNSESEVFVFPTATSLDSFALPKNLTIGVQNAYGVQNGSYTGEIGVEQLEEFAIKTILIGHSERRDILGETQEQIAKKYQFFKDLGYVIVYCIGESLETKEQGIGATLEYLFSQLEGIDTNYENLILAYEPIWAIGTGKTASLEDISEVHTAIKQSVCKPLLYGGSVKLENIEQICSLDSVDGALIGTASWEVDNFIKIIETIKEI